MKNSSTDYLFVYGSLRRDAGTPQHQAMLAYARYHADGSIRARLSWVDGYPVADLEDTICSDVICGEIYALHDAQALFAWLDDYEDCLPSSPLPHVYRRIQYPVNLDSGMVLPAWIYVAA